MTSSDVAFMCSADAPVSQVNKSFFQLCCVQVLLRENVLKVQSNREHVCPPSYIGEVRNNVCEYKYSVCTLRTVIKSHIKRLTVFVEFLHLYYPSI